MQPQGLRKYTPGVNNPGLCALKKSLSFQQIIVEEKPEFSTKLWLCAGINEMDVFSGRILYYTVFIILCFDHKKMKKICIVSC